MGLSKKFLSNAAILGVLCGLGVALFLLGYFSGTSKKVPVVLVAGEKTSFEDITSKHERRLSVVRVAPTAKMEMQTLEGLEQLTRFRNEKGTLFAIDRSGSGGIWTEDFVVGFADGGPKDTLIYHCLGRTRQGAEYSFYSTFENCWGPGKNGQDSGFRLPKDSPSPLHLGVYSCMTPDQNRYLSLNNVCESDKDTPQEFLGYVRAATVLITEEQKPSSSPSADGGKH